MPIIYKGINDLTYRQVKAGDRVAVNGNECVDLNTLTNPEITSELGYDEAKVISQAGFTNTIDKLKGDYHIDVTHAELLNLMETSALDINIKYVLKNYQSVYRSSNRWASYYNFNSSSEYVINNPMGWLGTDSLVGWDGVARPSDYYDLLITPTSASTIDVKVKIIAVRDKDGNRPDYAWDHMVWEAHYNPYNKGTSIEAQRMLGDFRTYNIQAPDNAYYMRRSLDTVGISSLDDIKIYKEFVPENNLFVKDTVTTGNYINNAGTLVSNGTFVVTDFISIDPGGKYITTGYLNLGSAPAVCFYDKDKNFISGQNNSFSRSAWLKETYTSTGTITRLYNPRLNWDFPYDVFNCQWVKGKDNINWMFSNLENLLVGSSTGQGWVGMSGFNKVQKDYVFTVPVVSGGTVLQSNSFKLTNGLNYKLKFSVEYPEIPGLDGEVYISTAIDGDKVFTSPLNQSTEINEYQFDVNLSDLDESLNYYMFINLDSSTNIDVLIKNIQLVQSDDELERFNFPFYESGQSQYFFTFNRGVLGDMSVNTVREDFVKNSINNVILGRASVNYYGTPNIWNYCNEEVLKDPAGYFESPTFNLGEDNNEYGHYNNQGNVFMQLFDDIEVGGRGYSDIYLEPYSYDNLVVARSDNRILGFFFGQLARNNKVKAYFISRLSIGHHATDNTVEGNMWVKPSLFQSIRIKEWSSSCLLRAATSLQTIDVDGYKVVADAANGAMSRLNIAQAYDINLKSSGDIYRFASNQGVYLSINSVGTIQRLEINQGNVVNVNLEGMINEVSLNQVSNTNINCKTNFQRSNLINVVSNNITAMDDEIGDLLINSSVYTDITAKGEIKNVQIKGTGYDLTTENVPIVKVIKAESGDIKDVIIEGKLAPEIISTGSIKNSTILNSKNSINLTEIDNLAVVNNITLS